MPLRRRPEPPTDAPGVPSTPHPNALAPHLGAALPRPSGPPLPTVPPAPHPNDLALTHPSDPAEPPAPGAPLPPAPEPPPSAAQLRTAARELAQAAERTERAAREILGRAHALSESLARSLADSRSRSARDALSVILIGALLSATAAVLATLVPLAELEPRLTVLDLLRILLRAG